MYFRENKEKSLKDLVAQNMEALGSLKDPRFNGQKSAGFVWNKICGDLGRKHTKGIYVEIAKHDKELPILHVYLDSHALIQDFTTDAPLLQAKLANEGFPVKKILFQLSRKAGK